MSDEPEGGRAGALPPVDEVAARLVRAVWQLRRVVRRRARRRLGFPALSPAEAELLAVVYEQPGVSVKGAAAALRLRPNTVSTLVNRLVDAGLVSRTRAASDQRVARLELTRSASRLAASRFDEATGLLTGGLERLSSRERRTLAAALPVVDRLIAMLDET